MSLPSAPPWTPVLAGADRDLALAQARTILAAVQAHPADDPSLVEGHAGRALALAYGAPVLADARAAAERAWSRAAAQLDDLPAPALYSGFAGLAWATEHLSGPAFGVTDAETNAPLDEVLLELLGDATWAPPVDLINGLTGVGFYGLERLPHAAGRAVVAAVLARLEARAERHAAGLTWRADTTLGPQRDPYVLGVAHGVPGQVAFLAAAHAAGVDPARTRALLEDGTRWLLAHEDPRHGFALSTGPQTPPPRPVRLAWCYGDAGNAVVLHHAARALGSAELRARADRAGHRAAARALDAAGVVDACLCHGAAGLGLIFQRLFHATRDPVYRDAAVRWFRETLARARPGAGVGGYVYIDYLADDRGAPAARAGLLEGAAGVALALLAAATPHEPAWDRVLALSLRPAA